MTRLNTADNGDTWVHYSPHVKLHQFTLNKVMFDNSLFGYLSHKCPKSRQLTMISSIFFSSTNFVCIHMPPSRLGQVKINQLFAGRYTRKSEQQITRVTASVIKQKPTELQCELPDFDANVTRWYEAGKWGTGPCSDLSICCQSIDRLFVNEIKLI